jgi:hypothetical protein
MPDMPKTITPLVYAIPLQLRWRSRRNVTARLYGL